MELPSKKLEKKFNTRPKIEKHMLYVVDKSVHEEHLSQPLQTNNEHFKKTVSFLTGYNGFFFVTNKHNKSYFTVSINHDEFSVIAIPPVAYELESSDHEIEQFIIEDGCFTENCPFIFKPNFSALCSIIETKPIFHW